MKDRDKSRRADPGKLRERMNRYGLGIYRYGLGNYF